MSSDPESLLTLRVIERIRDIPSGAWNALVATDGPDASPFVEHAWLDALEETGCVGEKRAGSPRT